MDRDQKRTWGLGVFIAIIILAAVGYFVWANFLNKGTLSVLGQAPFAVEIYGGENFICDVSPCDIKLKSGLKDLFLKKEGYKTVITDAEVRFWRTTDLKVVFEIVPTIIKADQMPEEQDSVDYELLYDEANKRQKLVLADDVSEKAVVYFSNEVQDAEIFGSENFVLIIENKKAGVVLYKIDVKSKSRARLQLNGVANITEGEWSYDGKHFLFLNESGGWRLLDTLGGEVVDLKFSRDAKVAWLYDGSLFFATNQNFVGQVEKGNHVDSYISLEGGRSASTILFGHYHPEENLYTRVDLDFESTNLPVRLVPAGNGQTIYFEMGVREVMTGDTVDPADAVDPGSTVDTANTSDPTGIFKIILRKF